MRNNFTRRFNSIAFALSALLTLCSVERQVHAQEPVERITFVYGSFGIAPNQAVRYTWRNLNDPDPLKRLVEPLRIRVRLLTADGSVIAQQEAAAVGAGRSQSFEFDRDGISLPGEPGTARIQVRLEPTLIVILTRTGNIANLSILKTFGDAIEVFDNSDGRTTLSFGGGLNAISVDDTSGRAFFNPNAFQIISAGRNNYLFGITADQTLRVTIARVSGEARKPPPDVNLGVWVLDSSGRVVSQSPYLQMPLIGFRIFDFDGSSLPMTAELGTGRKQVRVVLVTDAESPTSTDLFIVSLESIGGDGRTQASYQGVNNLKQIGVGSH